MLLRMVVTIALCSSCYTPRYMYSPSALNVPILVKQGDSKLAANYSTAITGSSTLGTSSDYQRKQSNGFDLQGAVAVTNHFALMANYYQRSERNRGTENAADVSVIKYKRRLTEVGLGYFTPLHQSEKVMFQVFAGMGKGRFSFIDDGIDLNSNSVQRQHAASVIKVFLQPGFQFRIKENFALAVASRLSIINYKDINTNYSTPQLETYLLNDIDQGAFVFWEPSFTNTIGFNGLPGVKLEYQLGASIKVTERALDYRTLNFSLGVQFDVRRLFSQPPSGLPLSALLYHQR